MTASIVLLPGPLVRASSWEPTAEVLRARGHNIVLPEVISSPEVFPSWRTWSAQVLALLPTKDRLTLVGHSSASVLASHLASMVDTEAIVLVDGLVPPASGPVGPVPTRLLGMLDTISDASGLLPPWCDWWEGSPLAEAVGIPALKVKAQAYQQFRMALPRMPRRWFNETIELNNWRHIPTGYLQLSSLYTVSADEAVALGWPVVRLQGTHLHPTLAPAETASAIESLCARLRRAV